MSSEPEQTGIEITVEVNGQRYEGWYFVSDESVTVSCPQGRASAVVQGATHRAIARKLLRKLVAEGPA